MPGSINRRKFIAGSALGAGAGGLFLSCEERTLAEKQQAGPAAPDTAAQSERPAPLTGLPTGKIRDLTVSKLICGGNLISGYAHSRDLIYVSPLVRRYNTDDKILETLEICEENGVNTVIADPREHPIHIFQKFWKERGGKMQWISESYPTRGDLSTTIDQAIDNGAAAVYVQGAAGDKLVEQGDPDVLGLAVDYIHSRGLPAGIGGHRLEVIVASERGGYNPDFYMKTLNNARYWSAQHPEINDNIWALDPEETVAFMQEVKKPWIAFKILGAGAINPRQGLRFVFEQGADFAVVGMFDWQVRENVELAVELLGGEVQRERPWFA